MNAKDLAMQLKVGVLTIIEYGKKANIIIAKPSQKLSPDEINTISDIRFGKYTFPILSKKASEVINTDEIPQVFQTDNSFSQQTIELIQAHDLFEGRKPRYLKIDDSEVSTIFSDFEACSICNGLTDARARLLARKYSSNQYTNSEIIELHTIANDALRIHGSKLLSFVIGLPALPFKAVDATQIFSELDKRKDQNRFPILRILFRNADGATEKIQISFYAEKVNDKRIRHENIILVKNQSTQNDIMKISRDGLVVPEPNAKSIIPILQLFIRFSKKTKEMIINYGLQTGDCSICGKELTDPLSIKRGIGPVCYRN